MIPHQHKWYHTNTNDTTPTQMIPHQHKWYHTNTNDTTPAQMIPHQHRWYHTNTDDTTPAQMIPHQHRWYHTNTNDTTPTQTIPHQHKWYHTNTNKSLIAFERHITYKPKNSNVYTFLWARQGLDTSWMACHRNYLNQGSACVRTEWKDIRAKALHSADSLSEINRKRYRRMSERFSCRDTNHRQTSQGIK
jgi:glucan-binding YG repeat protein